MRRPSCWGARAPTTSTGEQSYPSHKRRDWQMANITLTVANKVITADLMPTLWSKDTFVTSGITLTGLSVKLKASDGRYANAGEGREIATDVTMTISGGNGTATDMD